MKKIVLITLSLLCVLMLLSGCGGSSKLVGVWTEVDGDGILYFAEDNTGLSAKVTYTSESFEYEEKDEKLTFIAEITVETKYTIDKNILTITVDGTDYRYKLVELSESEIDGYLADNGIKIKDFEDGKNKTDTTYDETSRDIPSTDIAPSNDNTPDKTPSDKEIAESIVGAWKGGDDNITLVYIFYEDGTGVAAFFPFTYTIQNGVITVEMDSFGTIERGSARYEVEGDCMYIENDDGIYLLQRTEMPENLPEISK